MTDVSARRLATEPALRAELGDCGARRLASLDREFARKPPRPAAVGCRRSPLSGACSASAGSAVAWWRSAGALARRLAAPRLAAIAVVAIGLHVATPRPDPNAFAAQLVAALNAEGSNVSVVALYNATTNQVRLTTVSGTVVADKDYELWAIEGSASAPKSLGVIKIDARNDVKVAPDVLAGFGPGTVLAITLEAARAVRPPAPRRGLQWWPRAKGAATQILATISQSASSPFDGGR